MGISPWQLSIKGQECRQLNHLVFFLCMACVACRVEAASNTLNSSCVRPVLPIQEDTSTNDTREHYYVELSTSM